MLDLFYVLNLIIILTLILIHLIMINTLQNYMHIFYVKIHYHNFKNQDINTLNF